MPQDEMYLHKKSGLCFLAHPRTASRAVRDALFTVGFEGVGGHHDGPEQGYDLSEYQVIFGVRHHWDALVSWWYNARMHVKEKKPSLGWLAIHISTNRYYFRPGTMWWFLQTTNDPIYFHYENLEPELNAILAAHSVPEVKLNVVGRSKDRRHRPYQEYYDTHTSEFVRWCFMPEILKLGYDFEWDGHQGVPE